MSIVVFIIAAAVEYLQTVASHPVVKSTVLLDPSGHGRSSYEVKETERADRYLSPHLYTLVSTLEVVGILENANGTNCFILDNITKEWQPTVEGFSVVQVSLQLRQFEVPDGARRGVSTGSQFGRGKARPKWEEGENIVTDSDDVCLGIFARTTTLSSATATATPVTHYALEQDETSITKSPAGNNKTAVVMEDHKIKTKPKEEEHTGLNKRQILVISTCSTVIGAFFVTAFILRIRFGELAMMTVFGITAKRII